MQKSARLIFFTYLGDMFTSIANISPFGGIFAIDKQIKTKKVSQFINQELGNRGLLTTYSYTDAILTDIYTVFCGGSAIEDVNYIRKNTLEKLKNFRAPSPDTLSRINKELSVPSKCLKTLNSENLININSKMNKFLVRSAKFFDVLKKNIITFAPRKYRTIL